MYWLLWCDHAANACLPSSILLFSPLKLSIQSQMSRGGMKLCCRTHGFGFACQWIFWQCYENQGDKTQIQRYYIIFIRRCLFFFFLAQFHGTQTIQIKSDYGDRVCLNDYVDALIRYKKRSLISHLLRCPIFNVFQTIFFFSRCHWSCYCECEIFTLLRFHTIYKWHKLNQSGFYLLLCNFFSNFVLS